jgi:hypothetical protein
MVKTKLKSKRDQSWRKRNLMMKRIEIMGIMRLVPNIIEVDSDNKNIKRGENKMAINEMEVKYHQ